MKKSKIILIICGVVLLIGVIVTVLLLNLNRNKHYTLIVNGKEIAKDNVKVVSGYAILPLTEVMKAFDMTVNWIDEKTAEVSYKDNTYLLNISDVTMCDSKTPDSNLLLTPPGGRKHYYVLGDELMLDSTTIQGAFFFMGTDIRVSIDKSEGIVDVHLKQD